MGKEAQQAMVLNDEVQKKFDECVAAMTAARYGREGPPEDTAVPGERDMLLKCGNNASCQSLRLAVQSAVIAFTACIAEISSLAIIGGSS
jgi:hypothetical protein